MDLDERTLEKFVYREARLMDEHRYREWLSLWSGDALYWVPCGHGDVDPEREVSIIYDNRRRLEDRVAYLERGTISGDARPRIRRVVSNVESERMGEAEAEVRSNFVLVEARGEHQLVWCGQSIHRVRAEPRGLAMFSKKVLLVNSEQEMEVFQFLI
jgi:3-phenylpropionate/cinnamic acid dioxygenase small subunit